MRPEAGGARPHRALRQWAGSHGNPAIRVSYAVGTRGHHGRWAGQDGRVVFGSTRFQFTSPNSPYPAPDAVSRRGFLSIRRRFLPFGPVFFIPVVAPANLISDPHEQPLCPLDVRLG